MQVLEEVFRDFDKDYDGTLFSKHSSEKLIVNDLVINRIIHGLYESSDRVFFYDFSAIDADVLGNIYEEYLGYVLKKGMKKPTTSYAKRKKMGIYYTPTFVVDYIAKNTIGSLINQLSPEEVENIKNLDPACGSGSFLIKAYDYLLEYNKKHSKQEVVSIFIKNKILTDNIYGVDLDPKAIEIAQLNLFLRTVEKRKTLPQLHNNVKIGNSLIDDPNIAGDQAFNWNKNFKEIMAKGGFDVIVGNPPYLFTRGKHFSTQEKEYFKNFFEKLNIKQEKSGRNIQSGKLNLYSLFLIKAINLLKKMDVWGL